MYAAPPPDELISVATPAYRGESAAVDVKVHERTAIERRNRVPSDQSEWLMALHDGLGHTPFLLEAVSAGRAIGSLPLSLVQSRLFGRFLVSLPYLNSAGIEAEDSVAAVALVDRAVQLADQLDVRYLEFRHQRRLAHPALAHELTSKVHMRLPLPATPEVLWDALDPKVRNQIRKARKEPLTVHWGRDELLDDYHAVFSRNMRDLGTPTFGKQLFASILKHFPERAELCVVRHERTPVAAALLVHDNSLTEVPSASSLRRYNYTNANMLMYWNLLSRAIQRGQQTFDFGRSSRESGTYRFKEQWGAVPHPAVWQYYVRRGSVGEMRPDSPRYRRMIGVWKRLPVWLTRLIGPTIVRGIP